MEAYLCGKQLYRTHLHGYKHLAEALWRGVHLFGECICMAHL